jgi:hypothetical protein
MSEMIRLGRLEDLDYTNLAEYLADMARRDRREVESRLTTLISHVLKWSHQPEGRSRSWQVTIVEQRQELEELLSRGVLRNHAQAMLPKSYAKAVERASAETGLAASTFPEECPFSLDQLLSASVITE